jgi:hypothetical protein
LSAFEHFEFERHMANASYLTIADDQTKVERMAEVFQAVMLLSPDALNEGKDALVARLSALMEGNALEVRGINHAHAAFAILAGVEAEHDPNSFNLQHEGRRLALNEGLVLTDVFQVNRTAKELMDAEIEVNFSDLTPLSERQAYMMEVIKAIQAAASGDFALFERAFNQTEKELIIDDRREDSFNNQFIRSYTDLYMRLEFSESEFRQVSKYTFLVRQKQKIDDYERQRKAMGI